MEHLTEKNECNCQTWRPRRRRGTWVPLVDHGPVTGGEYAGRRQQTGSRSDDRQLHAISGTPSVRPRGRRATGVVYVLRLCRQPALEHRRRQGSRRSATTLTLLRRRRWTTAARYLVKTNNKLEGTHRVRTHAVLLITVNITFTFDLSTQNHTACRISQCHFLYRVWDHSFLSYAADKTERQTNSLTRKSYPCRPT